MAQVAISVVLEDGKAPARCRRSPSSTLPWRSGVSKGEKRSTQPAGAETATGDVIADGQQLCDLEGLLSLGHFVEIVRTTANRGDGREDDFRGVRAVRLEGIGSGGSL